MEYTTLANGVKMPMLGYGVFQIGNAETEECVAQALHAGYRLIDTAQSYGNEGGVGAAIAKSGVPREDLFVVSKVWVSNYRYEDAKRSIDESLARLGLECLDLMLLHQCYYDVYGAWRALEEAYAAGKVRAIGVSNFKVHQLKSLMETEIKPMVDQIENHPGFWQPEIIEYCQKNGILVEAWSPMGSGAVLGNEQMKALADKYGKSVAHMCIRWNLQKNVLPLPKSVTPSRIIDNTKVFDFEISDADMKAIDAIENVGYSGNNPDTFDVM